ncbi:MAG: hypothetical protein H6Q89_4764 [Myxococcaceae bacterium]|nr:hypothetical protein [Myxococcaceae bacterium]
MMLKGSIAGWKTSWGTRQGWRYSGALSITASYCSMKWVRYSQISRLGLPTSM